MKTTINVSTRLFAFAAVAVLGGLAFATVPVRADVSPVPAVHVGPGLGSVKTPPFGPVSAPGAAQSNDMQFHVDTNQTAPTVHVGPGLLSVKGPGIH